MTVQKALGVLRDENLIVPVRGIQAAADYSSSRRASIGPLPAVRRASSTT
jgi:hypothetical protein